MFCDLKLTFWKRPEIIRRDALEFNLSEIVIPYFFTSLIGCFGEVKVEDFGYITEQLQCVVLFLEGPNYLLPVATNFSKISVFFVAVSNTILRWIIELNPYFWTIASFIDKLYPQYIFTSKFRVSQYLQRGRFYVDIYG